MAAHEIDTGGRLTLSGYTYVLYGLLEWNGLSRTNNTISFSSARVRARYGGPSGGSFSWAQGWDVRGLIPDGSERVSYYGNGLRTVGNENWSGYSGGFSVGVGKDQTTIWCAIQGKFRNDGWTGGGFNISFPAAGYPTGQSVSATSVSATTATLNASLSNWGNYCTAGDGQRIEYKKTSDGAWITLAFSTVGNHSRAVTGLTPATQYQMRTYTSNGAGQAAYSSTGTFTTLPAPATSAPLLNILGIMP